MAEKQFFECPICEARISLSVESPLTNSTCPQCHRQFETEKAIPVDAHSAAAKLMIRPAPEAQVRFDKNAPVVLDPSRSSTLQTVNIDPASASNPWSLDNNALAATFRDRIKKRKKHEAILFIGAAIAMMVLIALLAGLFVWNISWPKGIGEVDRLLDRNELPIGGEVDQLDVPEDSLTKTANEAVSRLQPESTPLPLVPPPQPEFFFHSKKKANDVWKTVQPHLLSLEIEGPLGKRLATGTLVDTRGWVLTSYQAIEDAWRIEATAARDSLAGTRPAEPLRDLVRGIIATDPSHDLALLAVNRRFVVSLADLKVATDNKKVQGEFLLQFDPPTPTNYYGKSEVQITRRGSVTELEEQARSKATALGLNSTELTWLTIGDGVGILPGSPLFDGDGTLQAMVSFVKQDLAYAVPAERLPNLINGATGEIKPLKSPVYRTESGEPWVMTADDPAVLRVTELNQAAKECEEFDWLPTDAAQYAKLKSFVQKFTAGISSIYELPANRDDSVEELAARETMTNALNQWESKLNLRIAEVNATEPQRMASLNQFAIKEIKKGDKNPVAFFGSIHSAEFVSSQVILKFDESPTYVSVPFQPDLQVMRPGTRWFFFVETMPLAKSGSFRLPETESVPLHFGTLHFGIGPIH